MDRLWTILLGVALCVGCSSVSPAQTLLVSGETINATGTLFIDTAKLVTPQCNAHSFPNWETFCPKFKTFEKKFKEAWPMATGLWRAAKAASDPKLQEPAEKAVKLLDTELKTFVLGGK